MWERAARRNGAAEFLGECSKEDFMRKILLIVAVALFVVAMGTSLLFSSKNQEEKNPAEGEGNVVLSEIKTLTISAGGDCTLATDKNAQGSGSFVAELENQDNDYSYFFKNLKPIFENDDLTIINFEGTLSNGGTRASKQFAFRGAPEYVNILTSSSIEAANLANNHSRDYGDVSYDDTVKYLEEQNIAVFNGTKTAVREYNGVKVALVGIYALTDEGKSQLEGVMESVKQENPEVIIVSFHWGEEKSTTPNEEQKELAHKAVDLGADLVLGHHPHVLQGIEKYNGKYICYSLGNLCFGGNKNPSDKDTMLFRQTFTIDNGQILDDNAVEIVPCTISSVTSRNNYQPTEATGEQRTRIMKKITEASEKLGDEAIISFSETE